MVHVTSQVPSSEETTRELEGAVVEKLRESNAFERVYSLLSGQGQTVDLKVNATITKFTGVSMMVRGLGGAFAGQAVVVADVTLTDGRSNEILGEATIEGASSVGSAFAGTTVQAIEKAAEEIAGIVRKK